MGRAHPHPRMPAPDLPALTSLDLAQSWTGRLATYRRHRHDEHREALLDEATRFAGLHLEDALSRSAFWADAPLRRRAAVLLYLVDRGAVVRVHQHGSRHFEAVPGAETWAAAQPSLSAYLLPTLELLAALRDHHVQRLLAAD